MVAGARANDGSAGTIDMWVCQLWSRRTCE